MGKAKKIGIGIGIAFVIFVVYGTMYSLCISQASQVLDEMLIECSEKYPTQTEERRNCTDEAEEKWREMFGDSPNIFSCPAKN